MTAIILDFWNIFDAIWINKHILAETKSKPKHGESLAAIQHRFSEMCWQFVEQL